MALPRIARAARPARPDLVSRMIARRFTAGELPADGDLLGAMRRGSDAAPLPLWLGRLGLAAVREITVDGAEHPIPARLYRPRRARGAVLFFHGGGFAVCSLDSHDAICARIARASGAVVVSVAYRLAPEHPYPAAIEDAYASYRWLAARMAALGGGQRGIVVAGDSAGGHIAAVLAMMLRDRGDPAPCQQVLYYPPTTGWRRMPSQDEFGRSGYLLTEPLIVWFRHLYTGGKAMDGPYLAPAEADDLSRLPPALIVTAHFDPLRDEGRRYADRLREAGVAVRYVCEPRMIHGFLNFHPVLPAARRVLRQTGRAMRAALDLAALGEAPAEGRPA